jgi:hypothetical protein
VKHTSHKMLRCFLKNARNFEHIAKGILLMQVWSLNQPR